MFRKLLKSLGVVQDKKHSFRAPVRSPFPEQNIIPPRAKVPPAAHKPFERSMSDPMNPRNPFGWTHPTSPNNPANRQRHGPFNTTSPTNLINQRRHSPFSPTNPMNPNSPFNAGRKHK
jgi:hypothetical protein